MTKKAVTFIVIFHFELGSCVCFLSEVNFYFSMIHSYACTVLHNILVCFSLREPIFRLTTEYYFSLTLLLVSLYVNPAQVCTVAETHSVRHHLIFVHVEIRSLHSIPSVAEGKFRDTNHVVV